MRAPGEWLFQSQSTARSAYGDLARAEGRQLAAWLLHDLRRTAATGMTELRILPHIIEIEAVLNHVSGHKAGVAGSRPPNVTALRRKPVS